MIEIDANREDSEELEKFFHVDYEGLEVMIESENLGGIFNNDFKMWKRRENDEPGRLLMTYKERNDENGYRVEAFSEGVLEKDYIEKMLGVLLPLTQYPNNKLIVHEEK